MKILIVEDDLTRKIFLSNFFKNCKGCDLASDGLEALDVFLKGLKDGKPYHLICLDTMMAQANRVKILKTIRVFKKQHNMTPKQRSFRYKVQAQDEDYKKISAADMDFEVKQIRRRYFKNVHALPDYQLEVIMETGTTIHFDFRSRLNTVRFGLLRDNELFRSVRTDGNYLIFNKTGKMPVKIAAADFMDLVLVDRRQYTVPDNTRL